MYIHMPLPNICIYIIYTKTHTYWDSRLRALGFGIAPHMDLRLTTSKHPETLNHTTYQP